MLLYGSILSTVFVGKVIKKKDSDLVTLVTAVRFSLQIAANSTVSMAATGKICVTCARQFINTHALNIKRK
jgi:hypothetical protein